MTTNEKCPECNGVGYHEFPGGATDCSLCRDREIYDARDEIATLRAFLVNALPYCIEACDQTVQCPECLECWWNCNEEADENWHAEGCQLHRARVHVGQSTDVRRSKAPNAIEREFRTPAALLRDAVLSGWWTRLSLMQCYPPDGVDRRVWEQTVWAIVHRLLDATRGKQHPAEKMSTELLDLRRRARRSAIVLVPRDDTFAAIRSAKRNGNVEFPGGKLNAGENPYDGALREGEEELGVSLRVRSEPIGEFLHVHEGSLWNCTVYTAELRDAQPIGSSEGEACWATREQLCAGSYGDVVVRILEAYDEAKRP